MKPALITAAIAALAATGLALPAMSDAPTPPPTTEVYVPLAKVCEDLEVTVYFSAHDAMMSSYAYRSIAAASDQLTGCLVTSIDARVISEEAHTDESLASLSEARAAAVLQALETNGIQARHINTEIADQTTRDQSLAEPLARRVEIILTAVPALGT